MVQEGNQAPFIPSRCVLSFRGRALFGSVCYWWSLWFPLLEREGEERNAKVE